MIEFSPEFSVVLHGPQCGLKFQCDGGADATHGLRVHDCSFEFACSRCLREYMRRVRKTFEGHDNLRCSKCARFYNLKKYCKIVKLDKADRVR